MVDPYEAELAEQAASGGSGSTLGGGFNFSGSSGSSNISTSSDDGGSPTFTRGKSLPGGGTQISGNTIYGGQIISDKTLGRNYDFESEDYQKYLDATGRSMQNPYGNTGLFSGIFGADKVNYNLDATTAKNILDAGFDRYNDFLGQDSISRNRGFGKLFGSPEGEMTVQGELRAQVPETTTAENLLSSIIPGASFLPTPGTTYVPMGTVDFQPNPGYDPKRDPRANQDLRSGPFSLLTDALSKGRDFIASKLSPAEELAAQTQTQARGPELSELSQTVSGGRFENESAIKRPLSTTTPTPRQDSLTFDGSIQNSQQKGGLRDNPNLVSDASDFLPNVFESIQQNEYLNDLLEDGTLYETKSGNKLQLGVEDGGPKLTYTIPFSLTT